jgi:anti-sigma factor ChrR (cupin superfamily)|tara:strand:+ start:361 stop:687 length:327 start_codon:yes stop_codon:yes gene_type:complete
MKITKLSDYTRGWIIGDFEPSIFRTKDFEVAVLNHKKGEEWPAHYHKKGIEYNVLVSGKMIIQNKEINSGDVFVLDRYEVADPVFLEDCTVVCVKTPSIPSDKFEVTK